MIKILVNPFFTNRQNTRESGLWKAYTQTPMISNMHRFVSPEILKIIIHSSNVQYVWSSHIYAVCGCLSITEYL
jgi:hypothetical protein